MALDLETLRLELEAYLDELGIAVFHGFGRVSDSLAHIFWDVDGHPDFRDFLKVGQQAGTKLVVFHYKSLAQSELDEASEYLEDDNLTREEQRHYENRIREFQAYEGFTCSLALSFEIDGRVYMYELNTEWYQAFGELLAELETVTSEAEEEEDDRPITGFFSNN